MAVLSRELPLANSVLREAIEEPMLGLSSLTLASVAGLLKRFRRTGPNTARACWPGADYFEVVGLSESLQ